MAVLARPSRPTPRSGRTPEPEEGENADQERRDRCDEDLRDVVRRLAPVDLGGLSEVGPPAAPGRWSDCRDCGLAHRLAAPIGIEAGDVDRVPTGEVVAEGPVVYRHAAVLAENCGLGVPDARQREPPLHGGSG